MQELNEGALQGDDREERLTVARAVARAVELGVRMHKESSPVHQWEEKAAASGQLISPLVVEKVAIWLQEQWVDTGECDIEAAAFRFDLPPMELRKKLEEYFRTYSRRERRN